MNKIRIAYENHWNFGIHIADTVKLAQKMFQSIGFEVEIAKQIDSNVVNVLIENFDDEFTNKVLECKKQGAEFIVIATEFLTESTFNNFNGKEGTGHYDKKDYWLKRYHNFKQVASISKLVMHLSDVQVPVYQKVLINTPVVYLPHVYFESLIRFEMRDPIDRDIDILFTGTMTDYRQKILSSLAEAGLNVVTLPMLTADFHREDVVSRAKLALNIPQNEEWIYPSNSRIYYHLLHNSPILSKETAVRCELDDYIFHYQAGGAVEAALKILNSKDYLSKFEQKRNAFIEDDGVKVKAQAMILSHLNV